MAEEQEKPLAPVTYRITVDDSTALSAELKRNHHHRSCLKWCGCITALFLILVVTISILIVTVFRVKDPIIKMNAITVRGFDLVSGSTPRPGTNLTVLADVSVKNPNVAAFKFNTAVTSVSYDGVVVGEGRTPPGLAKARRTLHLNVTIYVMVDKILAVPRVMSDFGLGVLPVSSYSSIRGKVKILKIIKRNVVVRMNCTMNVNVTSRAIQDQNCKSKVSLSSY